MIAHISFCQSEDSQHVILSYVASTPGVASRCAYLRDEGLELGVQVSSSEQHEGPTRRQLPDEAFHAGYDTSPTR